MDALTRTTDMWGIDVHVGDVVQFQPNERWYAKMFGEVIEVQGIGILAVVDHKLVQAATGEYAFIGPVRWSVKLTPA